MLKNHWKIVHNLILNDKYQFRYIMDQRFLLKAHASAKSIELIKEDRNLLYLYFCKVSTELLFEVNPREAFYKLILV